MINNQMTCKVLLVEDDPDLNEVFSELLGMSGYQVCSAHSAREALNFLASEEISLALVDISLNDGVGGYRLAEQIRSQGNQMPLIALTGWASREHKERARQAGFNIHISKPSTIDTIKKAILSTNHIRLDDGSLSTDR